MINMQTANGDCFLEKWQWTKTQFNFDPSFDLTTAPPTTLDVRTRHYYIV